MASRRDLAAAPGGLADAQQPAAGEAAAPVSRGAFDGMLSPAPCFRPALRGYDRVQVDTYVAWVETELLVARRQVDDLLDWLGSCAAELTAARRTAAGAADPAQSAGPVAELLRRAAEEADRLTGAALEEADRLTGAALEEADRVLAEARLEADARLRKADAIVEAATVAAHEHLAAAEREVDDLRRQRDQARESLRLLTSRIGAALQGTVLVADGDGDIRAERPQPVG